MATFFDQNHESNHKNSMVGQSIIIEVEVGDKVQVTLQYLYSKVRSSLLFRVSNHMQFFWMKM